MSDGSILVPKIYDVNFSTILPIIHKILWNNNGNSNNNTMVMITIKEIK